MGNYDPRTLTAGTYASLRAKCVVVDERLSLVGSANFTDREQRQSIEGRLRGGWWGSGAG